MTGRSVAQKSIRLISASHEILEQIQPASVRSVCYQLFNRGLLSGMTTGETQKVSRLLVHARVNGIIPWEWIVDETRAPERVSAWSSLADYGETILRSYRKDFWQHQLDRVEVWSEKGTIRGVLAPVLDECAVTFSVKHGFDSATSINNVAAETGDGLRRGSRRACGGAMTAPCILGIDPGLSGSVAFYFPSAPDRVIAEDMPVAAGMIDCATLAARIRQMAPGIAIVERVASMPKQGISSTFKFGTAYGAVIGILATLEIRTALVTPQTWKKHFKLDSDKEKARALALRTFAKTPEYFSRKKDHGRAEASLLALFGATLDLGGKAAR